MSNLLTGNICCGGIITLTLDAASVANVAAAAQTFTVKGLQVGDFVALSRGTAVAGVGICDARVSAADTLSVTMVNPTASPVDMASQTYYLLWFRQDAPRNSAG